MSAVDRLIDRALQSEYRPGVGLPAFGDPGEIPPVPVRCKGDEMENDIRKWGVVAMCEWFGHHHSSEFTEECIRILRERSDEAAA